MTALLVLSGVLELIGLICAGFGFRATWHEHARGEKFIEPMLRPVATWARSVDNRVRELLRRPGRSQTIELPTIAATTTIFTPTIWTTLDPPPDPTVDLVAYADVVTRQINHLNETMQNQRRDLITEIQTRETAIRQARTSFTADIDEVRQLSRQVAVGGLRLQVVGWLFLLAGIVVGTIANIGS